LFLLNFAKTKPFYMKNLFLALLISSALLSSCTKSANSGKACDRDNTAIIAVSNNSSNPYQFSIDGQTLGTLAGYSTETFTHPSGTWNMKATQLSGYIFTPTVVTDVKTVDACEEWTWAVPF
jgi:hypothetical protein